MRRKLGSLGSIQFTSQFVVLTKSGGDQHAAEIPDSVPAKAGNQTSNDVSAI
jgi:hypothetical protein